MKEAIILSLLIFLASCEKEEVVPRGFEGRFTKCLTHRGHVESALENSMAALNNAYLLGADGTEMDIIHTRDGEAILNHDSTLNKTARSKPGGSCPTSTPVKDLTFSEIMNNCELKNNEPIPTLENALSKFHDKDFIILLDFKNTPQNKTMELIKKYYAGKYDKIISAVTFAINSKELYTLRSKMPNKIFLSGDTFVAGMENGLDGVEMRKISDIHINYLQQKGKQVALYDINDYSSMKHYMSKNVNFITTDNLEACKEAKL